MVHGRALVETRVRPLLASIRSRHILRRHPLRSGRPGLRLGEPTQPMPPRALSSPVDRKVCVHRTRSSDRPPVLTAWRTCRRHPSGSRTHRRHALRNSGSRTYSPKIIPPKLPTTELPSSPSKGPAAELSQPPSKLRRHRCPETPPAPVHPSTPSTQQATSHPSHPQKIAAMLLSRAPSASRRPQCAHHQRAPGRSPIACRSGCPATPEAPSRKFAC